MYFILLKKCENLTFSYYLIKQIFNLLTSRNGEATDRGRIGGRYECQTYRKRQIQESSGFKIKSYKNNV